MSVELIMECLFIIWNVLWSIPKEGGGGKPCWMDAWDEAPTIDAHEEMVPTSPGAEHGGSPSGWLQIAPKWCKFP